MICDGYDGAVVTDQGTCARETAQYFPGSVALNAAATKAAINVALKEEQHFEEVFIGFDAAWSNYCHWIVDVLPRLHLAARFLKSSCEIAIPDLSSRVEEQRQFANTRLAYTEEVWQASLEIAGLARRITRLRSGLYRAEALHLFPTKPLLRISDIEELFRSVRTKLCDHAKPPQRIFILRERAPDVRMDMFDYLSIKRHLQKHGFAMVELKSMQFLEQAELFHNAGIVIAPHGAGLANVVFASDNVRVLELNKLIGNETKLRDCFQWLTLGRGLKYACLDGSRKGFSLLQVDSALERLCYS